MHKLAATLLILAGMNAGATTLKCQTQDFTYTTATINRDGSIGFDGTFITITSENGFFAGSKINKLSDLTKRAGDSTMHLKELVLPLSPKAACTQNGDSLDQDFTCSVKAAEVDATGEGTLFGIHDGSAVESEDTTLRVRVRADVELAAKITVIDKDTRDLALKATITEPKKSGAIAVVKHMTCQVVPD